MKVFISFSKKDHKIVDKLAGTLLVAGITPLIATQTRRIGEKLNNKVEELIQESDCVLVLLTEHGIKSKWVQQEIGSSVAHNKHIVPIKTRNVKLPAMLDSGIEYYNFTKSSPESDFNIVTKYLCDFAKKEGLKLRKGFDDLDLKDFEIIHLPEPIKCIECQKVEVHIWLCKICGQWLCVGCGSNISPQMQR